MAGESRAVSLVCEEPIQSLRQQCLQIASTVGAASRSFVLSDVDLSNIFVEELAYKAAAQPHESVLFYCAVAAPFRRHPLLHSDILAGLLDKRLS